MQIMTDEGSLLRKIGAAELRDLFFFHLLLCASRKGFVYQSKTQKTFISCQTRKQKDYKEWSIRELSKMENRSVTISCQPEI